MGKKYKLTFPEAYGEGIMIHGKTLLDDGERTLCSLVIEDESEEFKDVWDRVSIENPSLGDKEFCDKVKLQFEKEYATNEPITCPFCIAYLEYNDFKKTKKGWV